MWSLNTELRHILAVYFSIGLLCRHYNTLALRNECVIIPLFTVAYVRYPGQYHITRVFVQYYPKICVKWNWNGMSESATLSFFYLQIIVATDEDCSAKNRGGDPIRSSSETVFDSCK